MRQRTIIGKLPKYALCFPFFQEDGAMGVDND